MRKKPRRTAAITELRAELGELPATRDRPEVLAVLVRDLVTRFRTLGRSLAWLAAYDPDERVRDEAAWLLTALRERGALPRRSVGRLMRQAEPVAKAALFDCSVDDASKQTLAGVLVARGTLPAADVVQACFVDPEQALPFLAGDPDSVEAVEVLLSDVGLTPAARRTSVLARVPQILARLETLARNTGRLGTAALITAAAHLHGLGYGDDESLVRALETGARTDPERALALLTEIGGWPCSGPLGAAARELSFRLRLDGIGPDPFPTQRHVRSFVSAADADGLRAAQIILEGRSGLDSLYLLFHRYEGIVRTWYQPQGSRPFQSLRHEVDQPVYLCAWESMRDLLGDALATHEAIGTRVPGRWALYRGLLAPDPIEIGRCDWRPEVSPCAVAR